MGRSPWVNDGKEEVVTAHRLWRPRDGLAFVEDQEPMDEDDEIAVPPTPQGWGYCHRKSELPLRTWYRACSSAPAPRDRDAQPSV